MSDPISFLLLKFGIDFYVSRVFLRERDKFEFFFNNIRDFDSDW